MSLSDDTDHAVERKLVKKAFHREIAQGEYLEILRFPIGVIVLIGVNTLGIKKELLRIFLYDGFWI